jgi:DNA modification methylase
MKIANSEIGSARDNFRSPIHNWYKFTAGFSHRFVEQIIGIEKLEKIPSSKVFDPFAGCGTTLVCSQKAGVAAVGNESQRCMYDVIRTKLSWNIDSDKFEDCLKSIRQYVGEHQNEFDLETDPHPLLRTLYTPDSLTDLYLIRNALSGISRHKYRWLFKLALSQALHKVAVHPIAVPYIVRGTIRVNTGNAWQVFEGISRRMLLDTREFQGRKHTSRIHFHDSRKKNSDILDGECSICITSPPYLNNLDYGESSKVLSHFFEYTNDWNDITTKVRRNLVTASTTHYSDNEFDLDTYQASEFFENNKSVGATLLRKRGELKQVCRERAGKKSFDILTLLYFSDMFEVLKEMRRSLKPGGKAYMILGDSAPYGIYIPTTRVLGKIAKSVGFESYRVHAIRIRGTKWKSLRFRHSLNLPENVLILR